MLTTDLALQEERSANMRSPLKERDVELCNAIYRSLSEKVLQRFASSGLGGDEVRLIRSVDMRFGMQVHELEVPVTAKEQLTIEDMQQAMTDFIAKYEATYGKGSAYAAAGMEFVTFRVVGTHEVQRPSLSSRLDGEIASSLIDRRQAYFAGFGHVDTEFHAGEKLRLGARIDGPSIVQRLSDTVVLPPGTRAEVDQHGGMTITRMKAVQ